MPSFEGVVMERRKRGPEWGHLNPSKRPVRVALRADLPGRVNLSKDFREDRSQAGQPIGLSLLLQRPGLATGCTRLRKSHWIPLLHSHG